MHIGRREVVEALRTPEEIVASRPPDRVFYTEWWPVPKEDDSDPPRHEEMVAVEVSLFKVLRYEKRVTVFRKESRQRIEQWNVPALRLPVIMGPMRATLAESTADDSFVIIRDIPAQTVGRSETEYRRHPYFE